MGWISMVSPEPVVRLGYLLILGIVPSGYWTQGRWLYVCFDGSVSVQKISPLEKDSGHERT